DAIRKELLTDDEISWINSYHEKVRETLLQGLTDEWVKSYLIEASAAL
ncbi:MAG: M24 family metallopeptidase C-terminal domain-containing protein, partial [Mogibacterium sp.]|nr:M24 family metallopeptidase C-terminal domain-containing protein [Mogibacterium sp.]